MTTENFSLLDKLYEEGTEECKKYRVSPDDVEMRLITCSLHQNIAYLVLNFTSQVLNGGFQQYHDNGYYREEVHHLSRLLSHINGFYSEKVVVLLSKSGTIYINDDEYSGDDDDEWESMVQALDELDTEFYSYSEKFEREIEDWLQPAPKRITKPAPYGPGPWNIVDDMGNTYGPYDSLEDAKCDADRIDGIIT